MKITKTASGKTEVRLSKSEWETIGKRTGWLRQSSDYYQQLFHTIMLNGEEYDIAVDVRVTDVSNTGIGPYEFWGAKGYDKGTDYVEDFHIEDVKMDSGDPNVDFTPEQKKSIIEALYNSDDFRSKVTEEISARDVTQHYEDMKTDYEMDRMKERKLNEPY